MPGDAQLAPEQDVDDHRIDQHDRQGDDASAPEQERKRLFRRRRARHRDAVRDHIGPEGAGEKAEGGEEEQDGASEGHGVAPPGDPTTRPIKRESLAGKRPRPRAVRSAAS